MINRKVIAWALYDWANSAFALSVLAVLFPLFNSNYWSAGDPASSATARLAWITFAASLVVSILAPILGTIADIGGNRKRFLFVLAVVGALMTASLSLVGEGGWPWALGLYFCASLGFYSSTVIYDSMLVDVTAPKNYHFVSSLGFSLGYLGGALLLALHVWMLTAPETFGLSSSTEVIKVAFVSVGIWWVIFLLPLLIFVPEAREKTVSAAGVIRQAFSDLQATVVHVGRYRNVVIFLSAYCLYFAGVFTIISMAADYGIRLGFNQTDLVTAIMIANFVGFPATLIFGYLGQRLGARNVIYFALAVYITLSSWAGFMTDVSQFYIMAVVVGCVQGTVQGLSRSLYASLIPADQPGEFFGFYNMVTKISHVIGPLFVGLGTLVSDSPQILLFALMPLFVGGGLVLSIVRLPASSATAAG